MKRDDLVYVGHMRDLARSIQAKVAGRTRTAFDHDENLQLALSHQIQTIGEAARRVSQEYQQAHPEVPWRQIIGMRHKVVHDYLEVDLDAVWGVASADVTELLEVLERLAPTIDRDDTR